jgi:hypothetical protein
VKTKLYRYLETLEACKPALDWIEEVSLNDPQVAWDTCPDPRWLIWVTEKHQGKPGWPTRQEVVLTACGCAEMSLHLVPADEVRPRLAIATARRWAEGKATFEECRQAVIYAVDAANAVHSTSRAAYIAAYAAAYAVDTVFAVYRAAGAAYHAADAIGLSGGDFYKALADMADIVRKRLYIGEISL